MAWLWTFGKVPELKAAEILQISKKVTALAPVERKAVTAPRIIDVRTAGEYKGGHIAGAVNASFLPPWSFPDRVKPLLVDVSSDTPLLVICLSAHRSIGALKWLKQQGYKDVHQLEGGMKAWRAEGLPEVKDEEGSGEGDGEGGKTHATAAPE